MHFFHLLKNQLHFQINQSNEVEKKTLKIILRNLHIWWILVTSTLVVHIHFSLSHSLWHLISSRFSIIWVFLLLLLLLSKIYANCMLEFMLIIFRFFSVLSWTTHTNSFNTVVNAFKRVYIQEKKYYYIKYYNEQQTRKWRNFIKIEYGIACTANREREQVSVSECDCERAKNSKGMSHSHVSLTELI